MRLLLIEDEHKLASFIARALREDTYAVDVADTGEKGLRMAKDVAYDVILLDVRLPGMDGIEVCRAIRQSGSENPILMLTARSLVENRVEGLDAGADDYLVKPFALAELRARVRALIRRGASRRGPKLTYMDIELDPWQRKVTRESKSIALTSKEFALLELLLLRAPKPVSRTEIIEHVWDYQFYGETNLVDVYINRLRHKIDHEHEAKLIHTVRGVGYRLGLPE